MLAARVESSTNQLAANACALILRPYSHGSQAGDAKSNRWLEADRREQDVSDDLLVSRRNQRETAWLRTKALDNPRLER